MRKFRESRYIKEAKVKAEWVDVFAKELEDLFEEGEFFGRGLKAFFENSIKKMGELILELDLWGVDAEKAEIPEAYIIADALEMIARNLRLSLREHALKRLDKAYSEIKKISRN